MSADLLREAAALMKNRARGADRGPWKWAEQTHGEWYGIQSEFAALGNVFDAGNAFHIASWHPAVALAVADWLSGMAARAESKLAHGGDETAVWAHEHHALKVALTYLGRAS